MFSDQSPTENILYFTVFMCAMLILFDSSQDLPRRNNAALASCVWRENCRGPDLLFSAAPAKIYGDSGEEDGCLKLFMFGGCVCVELGLPFLVFEWKIIPKVFPCADFGELKKFVTLL